MWETPKTDWYGEVDANGNYVGDRFNATDFNRIKNNLKHLQSMAIQMYDEFSLVDLGYNRIPGDYFYADEINSLEENLVIINNHTMQRDYGAVPVYKDNGNTMDFTELNRLESAILDLYERLNHQSEGRRMFTWNLGMKEGL